MQLLILALIIVAPGDIYRCVANDGSVHYQGRPCAGEQLGAIRSDATGSERRLREWLNELEPAAARPTPARPDRTPRSPSTPPPTAYQPPPIVLPDRPTGQHSLAHCSEQFLRCADGDDGVMDGCVAEIPRCPGARSNDCCAVGFIDRYQALRSVGWDRKRAVRDALLGAR